MPRLRSYLIISDLQIPFEAEGSLDFCRKLQKEYKVSKENIICVGDEVDQYFGSVYGKNPDAQMSAVQELHSCKVKLKEWYKAFPQMRLCISNHGMRWAKKASSAEIPSDMIKTYQEVLEAPKSWKWAYEWLIKDRHTFRVIHGMGYSGPMAARNAALDSRTSTVIGHVHSHAGISFIKSQGFKQTIYGMNVGCLIDESAFAFEYSKNHRHKPVLGCGIIVDGGATPIFVPYTS